MGAQREHLESLGLLRPMGRPGVTLANDPAAWALVEDGTGQPPAALLPKPPPKDWGKNYPKHLRRRLLARRPIDHEPFDVVPLPGEPLWEWQKAAHQAQRLERGRLLRDPRAIPPVPYASARALLARQRAQEDALADRLVALGRRIYESTQGDLELLDAASTRREILDRLHRLAGVGLAVHWQAWGAWSAPTPDDDAWALKRLGEVTEGDRASAPVPSRRAPWVRAVCSQCQAVPHRVVCVTCQASACAHKAVAYAGRVWCLRCYRAIPWRESRVRLAPEGAGGAGGA